MNFQQLRIIREATRQNYDLTKVVNMLFTSQPGVNYHIRELEDELSIEIFVRRGKRPLGMTEPDKALLAITERILNEASNVRRLVDLFTNDTSGALTTVTTRTQARYSLPEVIKAFRELFPETWPKLIQRMPQEVMTLLQNGEADISIASKCLSNGPQLVVFPWFRWHHSLPVPHNYPLTQVSPLTLESIAEQLLTTYQQGIMRRLRIDDAFARKGSLVDTISNVWDPDVIKTYVVPRFGIGLVAEQPSGEQEEENLTCLDARHLLDANTVRLELRRG